MKKKYAKFTTQVLTTANSFHQGPGEGMSIASSAAVSQLEGPLRTATTGDLQNLLVEAVKSS